MGVVVRRFEVFLVALEPTIGSEIKKTRPCLVISRDFANRYIGTVIVEPVTSGGYWYPARFQCEFQGKPGQIVLDLIRVVDKARLIKKLGGIDAGTQKRVLITLSQFFAE